MSTADIVKSVIADTFSYPVEKISRATVAEDIDGWDSLQHTILLVRIGTALHILLPESVAEAETVGQMIDLIETLV